MVLKNLFDNYMEFEEIFKNKTGVIINLENLELNPTTILPLLCFCKHQNLKLKNDKNEYDFLINNLNKEVLFSKLPSSRIESDELNFITNYMKNLDSEYGGYFALRHISSELTNNVYDHAKAENKLLQSYIFSKLNVVDEKLDICIVDDGLSIPGLFEECGVDFDDDCNAVEKAIGAFSTVSDKFYERGNGLRTIVRLISEGNNGEMLIISRNGSLHICGENYNYYLLDDEHTFNGTLVSVRLNRYEIQNVYELLEPHKLNAFKYMV